MSRIADAEATRVLNDFQRDARAMLEQLLPALRQLGFYPEASVDGWGDSRDGRGTASTVALVSPKWLKPTDRTKQLARVCLELSDTDEWSVVVSIVAQRDRLQRWSPSVDEQWWTDLREHIRGGIRAYHDTKALLSTD